ncbi:MAG: hypothetical protein CMJ81_05635 [Planctomycetaceae bacterium]|nr:hypothetical protein [Planctomycetaceae bacterium]MBP61970.1 hypothetical protein [Planctomycetaceae bacterium]
MEAFRLQSVMRLKFQIERTQPVHEPPCQSTVSHRLKIRVADDFRHSTKSHPGPHILASERKRRQGTRHTKRPRRFAGEIAGIPRRTSIGKTSKTAGDKAGGDQRLRQSLYHRADRL